jgi:P-type Ca2+ transporter type 2C
MNMNGLTTEQAKKKLAEHGYNELRTILKISPAQILFRQIKQNVIIYLLFIAALISFFVGKTITGYVIFAVILLVITIGFVQEYKAETAIKALKQMIMPTTIVIRNGKETEIPSRELVIEDIIVLRTGDTVPADSIILKERELRINEAVLTGESAEIQKTTTQNENEYTKENTVYMGTHTVNGKATCKVIHTGMNTEFGKIAKMISTIEKEIPLQKKVNQIARYMAGVAIFFSITTALLMIFREPIITTEFLIDVLIVAIALSVSAFPEGFPVVLISTLATGAYRMANQNAIVNRMSIIETLGETTIICADKTGTITKGEMTVRNIYCNNKHYTVTGIGYEANGEFHHKNKKIDPKKKPILELLLKTSVLCNDAKIERTGTDKEYDVKGTPTEAALLIMGAKAGFYAEDFHSERIEEHPFSSERKMMTIVCEEENKNMVYSKGAPEILLEKCEYIYENNTIKKMTEKKRNQILEINKELAKQKLRTVAIAYKQTPNVKENHFEEQLIFLGITGMEDPPREEVKEALKSCAEAGIKVKMITGDNKETAQEIAKEIGLEGETIEGKELDRMTDEELTKIVSKITIFARVKPEHKMRIVRALKANKEIVTMTGDGVNDAPALKDAHIGVAMGKTGTDVSRESADLILKDDNFATIVTAIKEGRTIFNNIQKFVTYQLSTNCAELFVIFIGILIGLPLPLLAIQILFINLITDDFSAITLGQQPASKDIMQAKPRKEAKLLNKQLVKLLLIAGTVMGTGTLAVFYITLNIFNQDITIARTTAMMTLVMFEIANAYNFRSFRYPVHKLPLFANKYLVYASIASFFAILAVVYTPLGTIFETSPEINIADWVLSIAIAFSIIIVFDLLKVFKGDLSNPQKIIQQQKS